jgi:2'-5' RNA ligase
VKLIAIDVLVEPDEATRDYARALNRRLREAMPEGFALDDTHVPHITLLQQYVRAADLDRALDAEGSTMTAHSLAPVQLRAARLAHAAWDATGVGMLSLMLDEDPRLTGLQDELVAAVAPFTRPHGSSAAFFTDPGDSAINETTVRYVETFVPEQTGSGYAPHLTVGMGRFGDLEALEAEPFEPFGVTVQAVAVFQLGDNGTARCRLRTWPVGGTP